MKGNRRTFPVVHAIWLFTAQHNITLAVEWFSRDTANQQRADDLSKVLLTDRSDWRLVDSTYQELCRAPVLQGRKPTLDVFASEANTKVGKHLVHTAVKRGWAHTQAHTHGYQTTQVETSHSQD